jgi:membrane-anchored protein YejM (alkaline phosphatase superfamily)
MAYKMQSSVPELTDLSNEPKHILDMYGPDVLTQGSYAYNCLMARRLAERGVRFVQLMHAGWDQHRNLNSQLKIQCTDVDAPSAALIKDLKQRGLLEDTLVIWGGEFGRTPFLQGDIANTKQWGRDEFGFNAVKDTVHIHDLQATIMHLMGIDHEKFTFRFQGRQFRLTDVHGEVVKPILA